MELFEQAAVKTQGSALAQVIGACTDFCVREATTIIVGALIWWALKAALLPAISALLWGPDDEGAAQCARKETKAEDVSIGLAEELEAKNAALLIADEIEALIAPTEPKAEDSMPLTADELRAHKEEEERLLRLWGEAMSVPIVGEEPNSAGEPVESTGDIG